MTSPGIRVVKPDSEPASEGDEAIVKRRSSGASDTKGLNISLVQFTKGVRRP